MRMFTTRWRDKGRVDGYLNCIQVTRTSRVVNALAHLEAHRQQRRWCQLKRKKREMDSVFQTEFNANIFQAGLRKVMSNARRRSSLPAFQRVINFFLHCHQPTKKSYADCPCWTTDT